MDRIKSRDAKFAKITESKLKRQSTGNTVDLLKAKHGKKPVLNKTSLKMGGMSKPCFHPNGNVVFVSNNKVKVVSTSVNDGQEFSLLPLLMKHKVVCSDADLNNQFDRLGLKQFVGREQQNGSFEDKFFREMLSAKLPFFQLFAEDKQRNFDQQQKLNRLQS